MPRKALQLTPDIWSRSSRVRHHPYRGKFFQQFHTNMNETKVLVAGFIHSNADTNATVAATGRRRRRRTTDTTVKRRSGWFWCRCRWLRCNQSHLCNRVGLRRRFPEQCHCCWFWCNRGGTARRFRCGNVLRINWWRHRCLLHPGMAQNVLQGQPVTSVKGQAAPNQVLAVWKPDCGFFKLKFWPKIHNVYTFRRFVAPE